MNYHRPNSNTNTHQFSHSSHNHSHRPTSNSNNQYFHSSGTSYSSNLRPSSHSNNPYFHSSGSSHNSNYKSSSNYHGSSHQASGGSSGENSSRRLMVHLTDPQAAASILQSKEMRPGTGGVLGAGIYFCKTMDGCDWRALHHGTYILADVYLGRTEANLNLNNRPSHVGSTVSGDRLPMYVVNEPRRVKNIRYLDGTIPPNTDINDIEMRDRMPLIFAATPQDAANFIHRKELPMENRADIAGKGYYLWQNIPDARKYSHSGATTFLAADVYFVDCYEGRNQMPNAHDIKNHKSFRGNYNGTHYFMVKNPKNIDKIHYIGGVRPPPHQ